MKRPGPTIGIGRGLGLAIVVALLVAGCMAGMGKEADYAPSVSRIAGAVPPAEPEPSMAEQAMSMDEEAVRDRSEGDPGADMAAPGQPEQPPERLRVFSATLELSVASVERTREEVLALLESAGGYVESAQEDYLVLRVPAERFDATLQELESLGQVLSRFIETADVTDQFVDMERRLEIARAARERLYELLERTTDSDEQVAILREIRRLTEEIEQISSRLESLGMLVAYSRITVQLRPRLAGDDVLLDRIPFPWIAALDPLSPTIGRARRGFDVELPSDFARFSEGRLIRAESADGVRLRLGARENEPEGDADFWREALLFHRGPLYAEATEIDVGAFRGVSFLSRDQEPYVYWVLVHVRDRELLVAELFFPSQQVLEEHREDLVAWLREVVE